MERCSQVLNEANTTKVRLLMRLRDTTLSVILRLSASRSWPPRFRYSMGPTTASPGGQGEATGRGERWGGWFGREIARQNQISFRRRRVWTIEQPSGQRPIWLSRQPILPVITLLAALSLSLVRPWGRMQRRRRMVGVSSRFLSLGSRNVRNGREKSDSREIPFVKTSSHVLALDDWPPRYLRQW